MSPQTSATFTTPPPAPEWLRLPAPGKAEPFTGLRRNVLYDLINARLVRSVSIKKPGAIRGVRLIEARSLFAYLGNLADEQANTPKAERLAA